MAVRPNETNLTVCGLPHPAEKELESGLLQIKRVAWLPNLRSPQAVNSPVTQQPEHDLVLVLPTTLVIPANHDSLSALSHLQ